VAEPLIQESVVRSGAPVADLKMQISTTFSRLAAAEHDKPKSCLTLTQSAIAGLLEIWPFPVPAVCQIMPTDQARGTQPLD